MATKKKADYSANDGTDKVEVDVVDTGHDAPDRPTGTPHDHNAAGPDSPAHEHVKDQLGDMREDVGKDEVLSQAVLTPVDMEPSPPERAPDVTYEAEPLNPLDSEEAWKEQELVATGVEAGKGKPADGGPVLPAQAAQTAIDHAELANASANRPVSDIDGRLTEGISVNSVIVTPDNAPPPINPLTDTDSAQKRIHYENLVNSEAETFGQVARNAYIDAALAGKKVKIVEDTGDEDSSHEPDAPEGAREDNSGIEPLDGDAVDNGGTEDDDSLTV